MSENAKIIELNSQFDPQSLQEFDSVFIYNPSSSDFTFKYDGKPYTIKSYEIKAFAKFVAFHLAKHLSTKITVDSEIAKLTKKQKEDRNDPIHTYIAQLANYDTHQRRIALYDILGSEGLVQQVISIYPFKGFIGEMDVYREYVEKAKPKNEE